MIQAEGGNGGLGLVTLVMNASLETQAVLVVCALLSIASWYVIATKWWQLRWVKARRREFARAVERAQGSEERELAMSSLGTSPFAEIVRSTGSFMGDLKKANARSGVERAGMSLTQLEALNMTLETGISSEVENAGRSIPFLAVVGATAPLLGLFGTVLGIIRAFTGIAGGGSNSIQNVAPGIAEALIATAAGLAAAIPAVIAYNVFTSRVQQLEGELERLAQESVSMLGREGRL